MEDEKKYIHSKRALAVAIANFWAVALIHTILYVLNAINVEVHTAVYYIITFFVLVFVILGLIYCLLSVFTKETSNSMQFFSIVLICLTVVLIVLFYE